MRWFTIMLGLRRYSLSSNPSTKQNLLDAKKYHMDDLDELIKYSERTGLFVDIYTFKNKIPFASYMYSARRIFSEKDTIETDMRDKLQNLTKHDFYKIFCFCRSLEENEKKLFLTQFMFVDNSKIDAYIEIFRAEKNLAKKENQTDKLKQIIEDLVSHKFPIIDVSVKIEEDNTNFTKNVRQDNDKFNQRS